ncbi:MAG: Fur family transcriptional regulator [Candidatus Woesearchaeota archaeon]
MPRQSRNTRQKELIKGVVSKINSFFNAEDIFNKLNEHNSNIGIATIYRYLNEAESSGELFSYICDRKKVYSKGKMSHCHFICEKTGKIIHFELDNIDFLKDKIPGSITSFQLEVKGVCDSCAKSSK